MKKDGLYELMVNRNSQKKNYDVSDYVFFSDESVGEKDSYIHLSSRVFVVSPKQINNLGFWVHEFSELTIIGILRRMKKLQYKAVKYKGFKSTTIVHLIVPFGLNNGRSLDPQLSKENPAW